MGMSSVLSSAFESRGLAGLPRGVTLSVRESDLIASHAGRPVSVDAGHELVAPGTVLNRPKFMLSGWVGLARMLSDGRRQIADLHVAGELTAFSLRPRAVANASYVALTPVRMIETDGLAEKVMAQPEMFPELANLFRLAAEEAHTRLIDHIVRVGRMLAHERMAHLALDLYRRFERVGLCNGRSFSMPLTQEVLGDVLGLSTVHVNRTLQQMRRDGLLVTTSHRWEIVNIDLVAEAASGARARNFQL